MWKFSRTTKQLSQSYKRNELPQVTIVQNILKNLESSEEHIETLLPIELTQATQPFTRHVLVLVMVPKITSMFVTIACVQSPITNVQVNDRTVKRKIF